MEKGIDKTQMQNEEKEQWESPVLLPLSENYSANNTFIGVDDGDSGSASAS